MTRWGVKPPDDGVEADENPEEGEVEDACLPPEVLVSLQGFVPRGYEGRHENQWQHREHRPFDKG